MQHEYSNDTYSRHTSILTAYLMRRRMFSDFIKFLDYGHFVRIPTTYTAYVDILRPLRKVCITLREHQDTCEAARISNGTGVWRPLP